MALIDELNSMDRNQLINLASQALNIAIEHPERTQQAHAWEESPPTIDISKNHYHCPTCEVRKVALTIDDRKPRACPGVPPPEPPA